MNRIVLSIADDGSSHFLFISVELQMHIVGAQEKIVWAKLQASISFILKTGI